MINNAINSNLSMLQFVASRLQELCKEVVFVGGSTTGLHVTDPSVPDVRRTFDVDCIVDIMSLTEYFNLQEKLRRLGFKENTDLICRWNIDEFIVDVMPTDEKILGFSNRWYKEAIKLAHDYVLPNKHTIRLLTAPYLLATKFEAFKSRGNCDYMVSHDFEDIITVIDGRNEIVNEIHACTGNVKQYLQTSLRDALNDKGFWEALPGHMNIYGQYWQKRVNLLKAKIDQILV